MGCDDTFFFKVIVRELDVNKGIMTREKKQWNLSRRNNQKHCISIGIKKLKKIDISFIFISQNILFPVS